MIFVQLLVSAWPNSAQAADHPIPDRVMDARFVLALAAKYNPEYGDFYSRALKALPNTEVLRLPDGSDYAFCRSQPIFAYYNPYTNKIHLCERVLQENADRVVQTIIHEAAHAAGFHSECDATRLSIYAMRAARRPVSEVGYRCLL
jgi:hypothetical protein